MAHVVSSLNLCPYVFIIAVFMGVITVVVLNGNEQLKRKIIDFIQATETGMYLRLEPKSCD